MLLSPRPRNPNFWTSTSICCCQDHLFFFKTNASPQPLERFPTFERVRHNVLLSRSQGSIVKGVAIPWSKLTYTMVDSNEGRGLWVLWCSRSRSPLCTPIWLDAATPPHGWMQLREPMQHSAVGHGSGRVRSICCYDHAVYLCVVNAIAFLCCGVGYNSIAIIITTFNKTCGM